MREVKDEKNTIPVFPRLHVNDANKGGPKAPLRNKMALYEQLSIPSQRSASGSTPVSSLIVSDISSYQRSISIQPPLQSADMFHANPSRGVALNTIVTTHELKVRQSSSCDLHSNDSLSKNGKCDSFKSHNLPNFKDFPFDKLAVTDLVDPNAVHEKYLFGVSHNHHHKDGVKHFGHRLSSALKIQNVIGKKTHPSGFIQLKLRQLGKNRNWKSYQNGREPEEASAYPVSVRDVADASLALEVKSALEQVHESSDDEMRNDAMNTMRSSQGGTDQIIEVYSDRDDRLALAEDPFVESSMNEVNASFDEKETSVHIKERRHEHEESELDMNNDHASDKSGENSILDTGISPDHVVRILGEKHFREARRAIINQQRIFIMQLFELHRVIKVQELVATSGKRSPSENLTKSPDEMNTESLECNASGKLLLPSAENLGKLHVIPHSMNEHHTGKAALAPTANYCNQPPWNLQNQWLVPYMSPSEGLVYKPFTGPCPPAAGFIAPFYGSCGPVKLNSGTRESATASYGVSPTHHGDNIISGTPLNQFYPPCPIPPLNGSRIGSEVEQVSPIQETKPNDFDNHLLTGDSSGILPHQSSCKISSRLSHVISGEHENHHSFGKTELKTITSSIQSHRKKQHVLQLFPTTPTLEGPSDGNVSHQLPRVIKVQPHNPRLANESAARIFKRIQEGTL